MWDLFSSINIVDVIFPSSVFVASLLGSFHCIGMCGALCLTASSDRISGTYYHLFRLLGYLSLGALAGLLGSFFLEPEIHTTISYVGTVLIGLTLFVMGVKIFRGNKLEFGSGIFVGKLWKKVFKINSPKLRASVIGYLTSLLPCGWLYSFVLAALAAGSALEGGFILLFFWLGTLPALALGTESLKAFLAPITKQAPKLVGALLIALSLITVGVKLQHTEHGADCDLPELSD